MKKARVLVNVEKDFHVMIKEEQLKRYAETGVMPRIQDLYAEYAIKGFFSEKKNGQ